MTTPRNRALVVLSPLALVALCAWMQYIAGSWLGFWAWVPTMLLFWACIAFAVRRLAPAGSVARWLGPSRGTVFWGALAVGAGLLSLPGFLAHWALLLDPRIFFGAVVDELRSQPTP